MKTKFKFLATMLIGILLSTNVWGADCTVHGGTNVTSGTSTDYTYGPVNNYYKYSTRQILYTKTDLGLAAGKKGTIKSIYFEYASNDAITKKNSVKIYMANTNLTALSTSDYVSYSDFTEVYSGALNCSKGWNEIPLATPFVYNGSGSLVVLIDDNSGAYDGSSYVFKYHEANTTSYYAQIYKQNDYTNEDPSSTDWSSYTEKDYRPNTKFCIEEAEITKATVNWYASGQLKGTQTDYPGTTCTAPTTPTSSDCDGSKVFVGWTATQDYEHATTAPSDLFTDPTTKTIPDGGKNYYAVFADVSGNANEYVRVKNNSDLKDGMSVVLVSNKYSTALTHTATPGLSYTTAPTESSSKITATDAMKWTLKKSGTEWLIKYGNNTLGAATLPTSSTSGNNSKPLSFTSSNNTWTSSQNSKATNTLSFSNGSNSGLEAPSSSGNWVVYYNTNIPNNEYYALKVYKSNVSYSNYVTSCATYNVTWKVNNAVYEAGGSTSVPGGGKVSALPIAPEPTGGCTDATFMGWTASTTTNFGNTPPDDLFKDVEHAPAVNEDVTYHAVFADENE